MSSCNDTHVRRLLRLLGTQNSNTAILQGSRTVLRRASQGRKVIDSRRISAGSSACVTRTRDVHRVLLTLLAGKDYTRHSSYHPTAAHSAEDGSPPAQRGLDGDEESALQSARGNGLSFSCCQTLSPVVGNRAIDDGATINALPGVENEKEIREPLQHHHPFALRTFHRILPGG